MILTFCGCTLIVSFYVNVLMGFISPHQLGYPRHLRLPG